MGSHFLAVASLATLLSMIFLALSTTIRLRSTDSVLLSSKAAVIFKVPPRIQALNGVSWAQGYGFGQGFAGEPFYYPYVETPSTSAVLETENKESMSTEARYPFVKYYGQAVDFVHGNTLDPSYYNYDDQIDDDVVIDNTLSEYSRFIGLKPDIDETTLDIHPP